MMRAICLIVLVLLSSCHSKEKAPAAPPPIDVVAYVMEPKTVPVVYEFVGFAESSHPVEIRARVEGYLDKIAYTEGQLVHEGDLLFQLDPKQFEAKVAEAAGDVAREKAIMANAQLTVDRLTPLYQQKAASKKDLDNATANLLASQAAVQVAEANLLNAKINLGYTTIGSPVTGYSDRAKFREGALINPGANSLLTTVSVLDPIWIYFSVSDNDLLRLRQEREKKILSVPEKGGESGALPQENWWEVEAITSDGAIFPYRGKVDFSSPTYNQSTGTLMVRGVLPNPQAGLRPGQFVRVRVYGAEKPHALLVPRRALLQKKNGMYVYLIDKDNKVFAQDVSTGEWYQDDQIITNGLKAGDKVIVDGINKVRPGTVVHVTGFWNKS